MKVKLWGGGKKETKRHPRGEERAQQHGHQVLVCQEQMICPS